MLARYQLTLVEPPQDPAVLKRPSAQPSVGASKAAPAPSVGGASKAVPAPSVAEATHAVKAMKAMKVVTPMKAITPKNIVDTPVGSGEAARSIRVECDVNK